MAVTLTWQGSTPGQPQFGLATLTEHYKVQNDDGSQITAAAVLTDSGVPQQGDAHTDYAYMFVTDRYCAETGESASALDVTYTGSLTGEGSPDLPPSQASSGNPIQTASSNNNNTNSTLEFYAVMSNLRWISYSAPGTTGSVSVPADDPVIRYLTTGSTSYGPGSAGIAAAIAGLFSLVSSDVIETSEIVSGKYWQNSETVTKYYAPGIIVCEDAGGGKAMCLVAQGQDYVVSDTLTFSYGGDSASVTVDSVDAGTGAITGFTIVTDTISAPIILIISATGGSGTGASFQFFGA